MGWQDRDYNSSGSEGFFGGASSLFNYSLSIGTWFGVHIRLYWLLLFEFGLMFVGAASGGSFGWFFVSIAIALAALILHEIGHRFAAMHYGLRHDEFILWPFGGIRPPPSPPEPLPTFIVHSAGIAMNLGVFLISQVILVIASHRFSASSLNPLQFLTAKGGAASTVAGAVVYGVMLLGWANLGLVFINLLPYYLFDGGYLWQAILWPWTGLYRAINVTCIAGMIIAGGFFLLALMSFSVFAMIFWGFLFYSAYVRRRQLQMSGTDEAEDAIAHSAQWRPDKPSPRRATSRGRAQAKSDASDRSEQVKIDKILDKVREQGMQSLTWGERRTLKQATERERRRAGAPKR